MVGVVSTVSTAVLLGLCFSGVALGLVVSFRFLNHPDLTVEGSVPLGGALAAVALLRTESLPLALAAGVWGGAVAGLGTAFIHVVLGVGKLLSGILMLSALYSVSLRVLGGSNLSLLQVGGHLSWIETTDRGWSASMGAQVDPVKVGLLVVLTGALVGGLTWFFNSRTGIAIRAVGDNEALLPALGRDPRAFKFLALALGNALAGLAGALVAVNQGFADVGMGQGGLVLGLAGLIMGEQTVGRLVGPRRLVLALILAAVLGSVLYQGVILAAFRLGVEATDVRLVTAMILLMGIVAAGGNVFYRERAF